MKLNKIVLCVFFIFISIPLFADVTLSDSEYKSLVQRLKNDKIIINTNNKRWKELRTTKPKATYEVLDNYNVKQKLEIPVFSSDPIKYEIIFNVDIHKEKLKFFPFAPFLCGTLESTYRKTDTLMGKLKLSEATTPEFYPDVKIGVQIFSAKPLLSFLNFSFNAMVGMQSSGISVSYTLPKFMKNTSVHGYMGLNYKTTKTAYGIGISLFF